MSDRCLKPEEIGDLIALSAGGPEGPEGPEGSDDPRWAHVDECPRCQALLQSYTAFLDPVGVPAGADLADAEVRLDAALGKEIGTTGKVVSPPTSFWNPFRVRTLAAAAAVVIVAIGLSVFRPGSEVISPQEPVLRGIGAPAAPFRCQVGMLNEGVFRMTWPLIAEATGYRVVVYGEDLGELATFDVGMETSFELRPPEGAAFCRVIAMRGGDEMGRSDPAYFGDY